MSLNNPELNNIPVPQSCMNKPYFMFLQGTGITLNVGRIRWYTTAMNRTVVKWASRNPQMLNHSFDLGVWVSIVLLPLMSLIFALRYCWSLVVQQESATPDDWKSAGPGLEIMIPGVNLPANEIGYYICALGLCSVVHELGHALAAVLVDVPVTGFGVQLTLLFPMAFTEINMDRMNAVKLWHKLRVLTAGIWHNLILAGVCYLVFISLFVLLLPIYASSAGVIVTEVHQKSPVLGARGMARGDVVKEINGCPVRNADEWFGCLRRTVLDGPAYCISSDFILNHDETVPLFHTADGLIECCDPNVKKNVCFEKAVVEEEHLLETPQHMCLEARTAIEHSTGFCHEGHAECVDSFCIRPMLSNSTTIIQIRRQNTDQDMMYIGHPADISRTVVVSEFIPKTSVFPPEFADGVAQFLRYVVVFSLGLALVNALPCYAFDGQHIVSALVQHGLQNVIPERSKRDLIGGAVTCVGTAIFAAGLMKIAYTTYCRYF